MRIVDGDPRYDDKTLTIVYVTNLGKRPVTINTVGAALLYPHSDIVLPNCNPLPHELTEGKNLTAILPPGDLDFSTLISGKQVMLWAIPTGCASLLGMRTLYPT